MSGFDGAASLAIGLAVLWILVALALSLVAARRLREANAVLASARSTAALLELAPARPLMVRRDGTIDADDRIVRELGLASPPKQLGDLAGEKVGLVPEDVDALISDIEEAFVAASPIARQVRASGSGRVLEVRGTIAPDSEGQAMLLWLADTSTAEAERGKLSTRLGQTEAALDALTHLIEAARSRCGIAGRTSAWGWSTAPLSRPSKAATPPMLLRATAS
jgi:hypothetical protein